MITKVSDMPNTATQGMRQQLYTVQLKEAELLTKYKPEHILVKQAREEIDSAKRLLKQDPVLTQVTEGMNQVRQDLRGAMLSQTATVAGLNAKSTAPAPSSPLPRRKCSRSTIRSHALSSSRVSWSWPKRATAGTTRSTNRLASTAREQWQHFKSQRLAGAERLGDSDLAAARADTCLRPRVRTRGECAGCDDRRISSPCHASRFACADGAWAASCYSDRLEWFGQHTQGCGHLVSAAEFVATGSTEKLLPFGAFSATFGHKCPVSCTVPVHFCTSTFSAKRSGDPMHLPLSAVRSA